MSSLSSRERLRTHSIESSGKLKISPEHHCDFTAEDLKDLGEIGRGAYGSVNKMVHKPTGQIMAVKVLLDTPKLLPWHIGAHLQPRDNFLHSFQSVQWGECTEKEATWNDSFAVCLSEDSIHCGWEGAEAASDGSWRGDEEQRLSIHRPVLRCPLPRGLIVFRAIL